MLGKAAVGAIAIGLCCSAIAHGSVLYTWETLSTSAQHGFASGPPLTLSFEIDDPLSLTVDSNFASDGSKYQFPAQLQSLNVSIWPLTVSEDSFASSGGLLSGDLHWILGIVADPVAETADLTLSFRNASDTATIGYNNFGGAADNLASTFGSSTLLFESDPGNTAGVCPCYYTGQLVALDPVPEPSGIWPLLAGLVMLGVILPRYNRGGKHRLLFGELG